MIRSYIEDGVSFGPETLAAMSLAFAETCNTLKIFAGDRYGREVIATRIIELARCGLTDVAALRDRVVREARMAA